MLLLKSSCNEQRGVIHFLSTKRLNANKIQSDMHPVYSDKCFTKLVIQDGVRKCQLGRNLNQIPRCNQSFVTGLDNGQYSSLHRA